MKTIRYIAISTDVMPTDDLISESEATAMPEKLLLRKPSMFEALLGTHEKEEERVEMATETSQGGPATQVHIYVRMYHQFARLD